MQRFYFDHNATTPVSAEAREALEEAFDGCGNASSIHHFGQAAKQRLETARRQVAGLLHCQPREVVFTGGGTESDNLAILGTARNARRARRHVVASAIEHAAVLGPCGQLEREGVEVGYAAAGADGVVDPEDVRRALRPDTVLISVMHVNNETGAIQPVREIAAIARAAGVPLHVDGVQAAGRIPLDLDTLGADLYSISGHKIGAPEGVGALFVREGTALGPIVFGGRHESGRRAGTENVPGVAALGAAAAWFENRLVEESARLGALRDELERGILERVPDAIVNAGGAPRVSNTANIRFEGIDGQSAVIALDLKGFAVSSGSACASGAVEPSHVLLAMGLDAARARSSVRFSLGRGNTSEQVRMLIEAVAVVAAHLRRLSPVYSHV